MKERIVNNGETGETGENEDPNYGNEYLATDEDFTWMLYYGEGYEAINEEGNGYYQYTGSETTVKIPHEINGHPMTSYFRMFQETSVEKVISDNSNITDMSNMFGGSQATTGYARTQADADRFNSAWTSRPEGLTFVVKP